MNERSRRLFLRSLLGSAIAAPVVLRSQTVVPLTEEELRRSRIDTLQLPTDYPKDIEPKIERGAPRRSPEKLSLIKPPALTYGSTIGIVAPASGVSRSEWRDAVATLHGLGFTVKTSKYLDRGFGYLAAEDKIRAEEFMAFVRDPEVDCIMAIRGGYGVMRILPLLDFAEIRANPKVIIGYSDITALVNPVFQLSGLIAFHGPVATSSFDNYTLQSFEKTVMNPTPAGEFTESDEYSGAVFSEARATTIVPGKATGRLVGGNLSLVSDLMGTPYEIDMEGKLLFLEEIAEEPYRVDRMMTQLALSGQLGKCAGVVLGRFRKCEAPRRSGSFNVSLSLEQVLRGILEPLKIPTVYGLSIGHITSKLTVPVGGLATLDADKKTLTINEAVVS